MPKWETVRLPTPRTIAAGYRSAEEDVIERAISVLRRVVRPDREAVVLDLCPRCGCRMGYNHDCPACTGEEDDA